MRRLLVAGISAVLISGCAIAIPGTPVVDESATPRPETGTFRTTPRDIGPPTLGAQFSFESMRMMAALPLIVDTDRTFQYGGGIPGGREIVEVASPFGRVAAGRLAATEVGVRVAANTTYPGVTTNPTRVDIGLFRMASVESADAVVSSDLLRPEEPYPGFDPPPKVPILIPIIPQPLRTQ